MEVFIIQFLYCYLETTKRWLLSSSITISMRSVSCNLWGGYLLFLIYFLISVSDFDLTFRPFVVIFDFYSAKVSQAGNTANTGTSPIDGKLFMTLRNQRLRFPENFYRPILCLMSP